ncbi:MAG: hypothetical protein HY814_05380 [Candidatus Riflebacteria bacterium]|nr:hypothetical protein [Candidatus Riflebacteria bacterium]
MTASMTFSRGLAFYLALCLLVLSPLQGVGTASAEVGVKTVVFGAAVGVGALFAIKAMVGPASAVATVGAAGTGVAATVGGAVGGLMSGVSSLTSTLSTGAMSLMRGLGSMMTTGLSSVASVVTQPWFYVPAAVIGAGLLVYHFYKKAHPQVRAASLVEKPLAFFDRWRARVTSRAPLPYAMGGTLPAGGYSNAYYGGMSNFYVGGPAAFGNTSLATAGGYGLQPASTAPVTPLGDAAPAGLAPMSDLRSNLQPSAPEGSSSLQAELAKAEQNRKEAYTRLVDAMKTQAGSLGASSEAATQAVRDYKAANDRVQQLREQAGVR